MESLVSSMLAMKLIMHEHNIEVGNKKISFRKDEHFCNFNAFTKKIIESSKGKTRIVFKKHKFLKSASRCMMWQKKSLYYNKILHLEVSTIRWVGTAYDTMIHERRYLYNYIINVFF